MLRVPSLTIGLACGFALGYWYALPTAELPLTSPPSSILSPATVTIVPDSQFRDLLRRDMDGALQQVSQSDATARSALMQDVLVYLGELNDAKQDRELTLWLSAIDSLGLSNAVTQRLWSRALWRQGKPMAALEKLSTGLDSASIQTDTDALTRDASQLITQITQQYDANPEHYAQDEYEALLVYAQQHFDDVLLTSLSLAKLYQNQNRYQDALSVLQFIPYDENFSARVDERIALIEELMEQQEKSELGIPLEVVGGQYIVRVAVGEVTDIPLLLDTGASYTSFDQSFVRELESDSGVISAQIQQVMVNTANGSTIAGLYELDSFSLGSKNLKGLKVLSVDMGAYSAAVGLLGMNVLDQFHFEIDQQHKRLYLKPKR